MLLDIDNFYGEHEGRLGPTLKFLLIGGAPILLWVYTGFIVPAFLFFPFWVVWLIRVGLITLGRERDRLVQFRKQMMSMLPSMSYSISRRSIRTGVSSM